MFKVYYDTPNGRPAKRFEDRAQAIAWAENHAKKCKPVVVEIAETVIWDWSMPR